MTNGAKHDDLPAVPQQQTAVQEKSISLFRKEALEYHTRMIDHGEPLPALGKWADWYYWGILMLVAFGLVVS